MSVSLLDPSQEWRDAPGYEGTYWVSSTGQVFSRKRKSAPGGLLAPYYDRRGYPYVTLAVDGVKKRWYLHVLVAAAFIGPRPDGQVIRHLDGDPANSSVDNLRYGSQSENELDKVAHGQHNNRRKTHCPTGHSYAEHAYSIPSRPTVRYCGECARLRHSAKTAA